MSDFKGRHFEERMEERGLEIDHTTLYRWVQSYALETEKRLRWHARSEIEWSWRVDETYVKE